MTEKKPDIIFIMVDQLAAKWLEAATLYDIIDTPNIDFLKKEGVSFSNAFTNNPICCAARATIATGLSTRGHGVLQNGYELNLNIVTHMQLLQQNGWRTGAFGKLHLINHKNTLYPDYTPFGFDVVKNTEDTRGGEWLDWAIENYPEYNREILATIWAKNMPEFNCYGKDGINLNEKIDAIRPNFKWETEEFPNNFGGAYTLPFPKEISQTGWITQNAIDYIEETEDNIPIFAHISYVQPHSPFCCPDEFMRKVKTENIPNAIEPTWHKDENSPDCFPDSQGAKTFISLNCKQERQVYFGDIGYIDENVGMIIEALKKANRLDNSYIFFVSDHGELLCDHGFEGKGERHYDACIRIPLILKGKKIDGNAVCNDFVDLRDIFPTILDICDIEKPKYPLFEKNHGAHTVLPDNHYPGKSLVDVANGADEKKRNYAYIESYNNIHEFTPINWARTIRDNDYRYTYYPQNSGEQLFNLKTDPDEKINLAFMPEYAQTVSKYKNILLEQIILEDYPHSPNSLFMLGTA